MNRNLSSFERQLCDIQGRLFELALRSGLDCHDFIAKFMNSESAAFLDLPYDRLQWAGEEYILENLTDEIAVIRNPCQSFSLDEAYWIGYTYRYWHFCTGESSREIYAQADSKTMQECYPGFHTLDVPMAIEDLKELHRQREAQQIKEKEKRS